MAEQAEQTSYTEGRDISLITSPKELLGELDVAETRYNELNARMENVIREFRELGAPSSNANMLTLAEMSESLGVLAVIAENLYLSLMTLYQLKIAQLEDLDLGVNKMTSLVEMIRMVRRCDVMARYYRGQVSEHAYYVEIFTRSYEARQNFSLESVHAEVKEALPAFVQWGTDPETAAA